jgi:hypothetical protein
VRFKKVYGYYFHDCSHRYIVYAKLAPDIMLLHSFLVIVTVLFIKMSKMYIRETWQKFMASSWQKLSKVDVRLFLILAARIAFWVFAHCILGIGALQFGYICWLKFRILPATWNKFATLLVPCSSNNRTCQISPHYNKITGPPLLNQYF